MHRETKKTQINPKTKKEVTIRDKGRCIVCGAPGIGNAHFIRRSQGGLGIKENLITLCPHFCQWKEYRDSSVSTDRKELYIDDLCVDETARGNGVATALFRHVTAVAKAAGAKFITLNVWEGNSARNFYDKMGMKPRKVFMDLPLED